MGIVKRSEEKVSSFVAETGDDLVRTLELVFVKEGLVEFANIVHLAVVLWWGRLAEFVPRFGGWCISIA